jgi:hypothetical protein
VIAITGLSLENALTGHGIKGNLNLNPEVLATGSNSNSNSNSNSATGTGTGTDEGEKIFTERFEMGEPTTGEWYNPDEENHPEKRCKITTTITELFCDEGGTEKCKPATISDEKKLCIEFK